jgi:ArsR family transcriptional regulator, lead/cadmium/zinc/bismuth-responsive transcriptional repressor
LDGYRQKLLTCNENSQCTWYSALREKKGKVNATNYLVELLIEQNNRLNSKLDILINLDERLLKLQEKMVVPTSNKSQTSRMGKQPDSLTLISLPTVLRKTVTALYQCEKATAKQLSKITRRTRAVESGAANQLVRLGYIKKKREGRDIYFYIEQTTLAVEDG